MMKVPSPASLKRYSSRWPGLLLGVIFSLFLAFPAFSQDNVSSPPTNRVLVTLLPNHDLASVIQIFRDAGVKINHQFPPDAFIATFPSEAEISHIATTTDIKIYTASLDSSTLSTFSPSAYQAAQVWNLLQQASHDSTEARVQEQAGRHLAVEHLDAFEAPPPSKANPANNEPTPSAGETSQFLLGSVAVGIVLPESNGLVDPSGEDWTAQERDLVAGKIVAAMDWWASRDERAQLSFVYDNIAAHTFPTSVEPITRPHSDQKYWIADTMAAKGFGDGNYFDQVRAYNNYLRQQYQTDWAFTIFVVDSSADIDNTFLNGYFAYAYLGGPFMVVTYGNQNYGPNNMDAVVAHELGHIFHALDQYTTAGQSCSVTTGYLNVANQNNQANCQSNEPSIMRGQILPYVYGQIDHFGRGQVGWQDANNNGVLDPVDAGLQVSDVAYSENTLPNVLDFQVHLEATPYDSPLLRDVLINKLQSVQYRVNDGPWLPAVAADGAFDSYKEQVTFTTEPLSTGNHTFTVRSYDNFGKMNEQIIATLAVVDPIQDLIDTSYDAETLAVDPLTKDNAVTLSGIASRQPDGTISAVQFKVDDGPWQPAQASDGTFNSQTEHFNFFIPAGVLEVGTHIIWARAVDNQGYVDSSPIPHTLSVQLVQVEHSLYLPIVFGRP